MAQQIENPGNQEKLVEKKKKELEQAKTIDVLETLREQVVDSELSDSWKRWFYSQIGRKKDELATEKEKYEGEIRHLLERLPVDENLREALEGYWIIEGLEEYPIKTLRKYKVPYLRDLLRWVYTNVKNEEAPVSIVDLEMSNLTTTKFSDFLRERFESPWTRFNAKSHIKSFGDYLVRSGHAAASFGKGFQFPDPRLRKPRKKRKTGVEVTEGVPRRRDELDRIMATIRTPTPRLVRWKTTMYSLLSMVLLQTGLRYGHILSVWRVHDITDAREEERGMVEDRVFDKTYYIIPAADILDRERERKEEAYSKRKLPANLVYLSEELMDNLLEYIHDRNMDSEDYIFTEPDRNIQARAATVRDLTGIDDFSFYDFRSTFASALFNMLGKTDKAREIVRRRGGWGRDSSIPFQHYIQMMSERDAIDIIKEYDIYVDITEEEDVKRVLAEMPVEYTPEEVASLEKTVKQQSETLETLKKEIEKLKKGE